MLRTCPASDEPSLASWPRQILCTTNQFHRNCQGSPRCHMTVNETDLKLLLKALAFAAHKHKDQRRKDIEASPYINHPISLANVLCNEGHVTDMEVICGALLHDTIEDTATTPDELLREFGPAIRDSVLEVSDDQLLDK